MGFTKSAVTKNKQISILSSYWRRLLRKGHVQTNPWREQSLPKTKTARTNKAEKERPFTAP
jgi:site-specific recombinase XerD